MKDSIQKAIDVLKQGGIVIFPTDTAFGIGCSINQEDSIQKLFKIRKRPENHATPVLVDTVKMAQDYVGPIAQEVIDILIEPFWPGALTIVLPCKTEKVPQLVRGGRSTLGVRIPNHPITRSIIQGLQIPILGPSANFAGEQTPYEFHDLNPKLIKLVDYVIEGKCTVKQASTVVDCSQNPWKILRQAAVSLDI